MSDIPRNIKTLPFFVSYFYDVERIKIFKR
jgi:hypothetical protein